MTSQNADQGCRNGAGRRHQNEIGVRSLARTKPAKQQGIHMARSIALGREYACAVTGHRKKCEYGPLKAEDADDKCPLRFASRHVVYEAGPGSARSGAVGEAKRGSRRRPRRGPSWFFGKVEVRPNNRTKETHDDQADYGTGRAR